jgi:hypothetical protein
MIQRFLPEVRPSLEEVQKQFDTWRNNKKRRRPIPEALWSAAIELTGNYTIGQISRALRLNYQELKRRVQARQCDGSAQFVEVNIGESIYRSECTVEMEDRRGAKMRMHIKGGVNLEGLAKTFWEKSK